MMRRPAALRRVAVRAVCAVLLAAAAAGAAAQKVYRCGPEGRTYQDEPCRGGRAVDVSDPRSDAQRRAARQATADDARLAGRLERERLAQERLDRERIARQTAALAGRDRATRAAPPAASAAGNARRPARGTRDFRDGAQAPPAYRAPTAPGAGPIAPIPARAPADIGQAR